MTQGKGTIVDPTRLHEITITLENALEYIRGLQHNAIRDGLSRADRLNPTQVDIVAEVLSQVDSTGLFVSEIAEAAGIPPGSVRMVLYSNKDRFKAERQSPRRIRWRLNEYDERSHTGCEAGEMVGA